MTAQRASDRALAGTNPRERWSRPEMLELVPVAGHAAIADRNFVGCEFKQLTRLDGYGVRHQGRGWLHRPHVGSGTDALARPPHPGHNS